MCNNDIVIIVLGLIGSFIGLSVSILPESCLHIKTSRMEQELTDKI